MKKCPYCAEDIQSAAVVCRYCGRDLGATSSLNAVAHSPEVVPQLLVEAVNTRNIGAFMALVEPNVTSYMDEGSLTGAEHFAEAMSLIFSQADVAAGLGEGQVYSGDDIALLVYEEYAALTAPDGRNINTTSTVFSVVRRQSDGTWRLALQVATATD